MDSDEYWLRHVWDRAAAIDAAPPAVANEFRRQEELTLEAVESELRRAPSDRTFAVMDVPCGTGRLASLLAERVTRPVQITLVDLNPSTLARAAAALPAASSAEILCASVYDLADLARGQFDVVICLDLFHHLGDLERAIDNLARVLRPGGVLVCNAFVRDTYDDFDRAKYGRMGSLRRKVMSRGGQILIWLPSRRFRSLVKSWGWVRIDPVDRSALERTLWKSFVCEEPVVGHYFWTMARVRTANSISAERATAAPGGAWFMRRCGTR